MREAERGGREEGWRARGREVESRTPPTPSSHPSLTPPGTHAWLVNTGWTGGAYGAGSRIKLRHTRAILDAIHAGALDKAATTRSPVFGLHVPVECAGVPAELLDPRGVWADPSAFDAALAHLATIYAANFDKYADGDGFVCPKLAAAIVAAGPAVEANGA